MTDAARQRRLSSGMLAEIRRDRWHRGAYELIVDGTPQSHVVLDDPRDLFYEYIRRMAHIIDLARPPGEAVTAVHLGAGALTLPRYIDATRPGSRQQVIELDRDLVDFVRETLPWDRQAAIRVRYGDARAMLARLPGALRGAVDLLVVDIFAGSHTPAHVTSVEFYREAAALLEPDGVMLVNIADGPPMPFARSQMATVRMAVGPTIALGEGGVLKGRRFGNVVLIASPTGIPDDWERVLRSAGPHPAGVLGEAGLRRFAAGAPVATDETATGSPEPSEGVLRLRSD